MTESAPFWKTKSLHELDAGQWESLCDGCGQCCLNKIEDADTGEVHLTRVVCRLYDIKACRCSNYANRDRLVPDCRTLTPTMVHKLDWLPDTCGYRRVAEGRDLPEWHPLVTGRASSVHEAGASLKGRPLVREVNLKKKRNPARFIVNWFAVPGQAGQR